MRRTTSLTAAGLLGLALAAVPATGATAAGETCRGEAATIVGTGPTLTGTEGRDVIVTAAARTVVALGGDDLICLSGTPSTGTDFINVDAGAGADTVDSTALAPGYYATTVLGAGSDTFVGGRAYDVVFAGEQVALPGGGSAPGADAEKDTIDTGDARDTVWTGAAGVPNSDAVTLGTGEDDLILAGSAVAPDAVLDGGTGYDGLNLLGGTGDLGVDLAAGTLTTSLGTARFSGYESASLEVGTGNVSVRGTDGPDRVTVRPTGGAPTLDVATGDGDDVLTVEPATAIAPGSRIDAGTGEDELVAATDAGRLSLDLATQRFGVGGVDAVAVGLEDAFLMAPEVVMDGDDGDNELMWTGCSATLRGGLGDDSLRWQYDYVFEAYEFRCDGDVSMNGGDGRDTLRGSGSDDLLIGGRGHDTVEGRNGDDRIRGSRGNDRVDGGEGRDRVSGGSGNDVLNGRAADDVLIGGPGRDRVDGSRGRDRCVAERKARCER
ncbi:calcium-binding protein [Nocardioides okcheonensis]|uniref:calcium-binding protein n=1 Tax=Nocardioides okcheonensis TaxID=2894081 RepID=UPI001E3E9FD8|nr:calcium-binding protein [Nocardioides okcheonensis]UFN43370.1 hypothetical protein LN652_15130 [Nocardioides okcheonensis]